MNIIEQNWSKILERVKEEHEVGDISFNTWLSPLKVYKVENNDVTILVPTEQVGVDYVTRKYKLPIKAAIGEITGLDWRLLKELDKARLAVTDKEEDFHGVEHVAIDEFSIEKGHRYATVAMDLDDRRVLWVGKGKRRKDVQPFFDRLRQKQRDSQIVSVSVDMNAAFPRLVKDNLPKALLAYDLFHVMKNFTHDVLAVAKAESILRARKTFLELKKRERTKDHSERCQWQISLVKGAEWLVVRDQETLRPDKREQLERLREENALFRDLYPLAAKLRSIWRARTKEEALGELSSTIEICEAVAQEHAFPAAGKFANMLRSRAEGIANACIVKKGTNMLEGANNKIKVIKRVGYGYRDFEYFAMKVKAAFPGKKVLKQQKTNRTASLYWMGKGFPRIFPQLC